MNTASAFMRTLGRRLHLSFTVYQDAALDALDALLPKSVVDTYSDTKRKRRACIGDIRVDKIRHMLDSGFGVTRSKMQISFHESFLAATSRHLYSEDENVDWARVKTQQGWEDTRSVVVSVSFIIALKWLNFLFTFVLSFFPSCAKRHAVSERRGA